MKKLLFASLATLILWTNGAFAAVGLLQIAATTNIVLYVATTGSDINPCSSAQPCLTIQHALNVTAQYNYENLYSATVNVASGTYSQQLILPALTNNLSATLICSGTCTIKDTSTNYAIVTGLFAQWSLSGFIIGGTFGGLNINTGANINLSGSLTIAGNFTNEMIVIQDGGSLNSLVQSITITATSGSYFIRTYGGIAILDGSTITFSNAITFSQNLFFVDSTYGFIGFTSWMGTNANFANPTNVTTSSQALHLQNGAHFEANAGSLSGGAALTRANFPGVSNGAAIFVDQWSVFQADGVNSGNAFVGSVTPANTLTDAIGIADGAGNLRIDYGITETARMTFHAPNVAWDAINYFELNGNAVAMVLSDTETNGHVWAYGTEVANSQSVFYLQDESYNNFAAFTAVAWNYDGLYSTQIASGSLYGWSSSATFPDAAAMDTGLSRIAANTVGIGDGTAGDTSGTLEAATITVSSASASSTNINVKNTTVGGHEYTFFSTGSGNNPGLFGVYDDTANQGPMALDGSNLRVITALNGVFAWGGSSTIATGTVDTGLSRIGAGIVAIGNGSAGNASGTLQAAAVSPGIVYSAAGTPLPSCTSALNGTRAVVSDLTTATYHGAYVSGGAITSQVICNGATTAWLAD